MGLIETSRISLAPLLIRNLLTSFFIHADKPLLNLSKTFKLVHLLHNLVVSTFLFLLSLLPTSLCLIETNNDTSNNIKENQLVSPLITGNSGIARALSQLLSIANDLPASSRKYEVVRTLAETLIEENQRENVAVLIEVNRNVLATAFESTLSQLEGVMKAVEVGSEGGVAKPVQHRLNKVLKAVRSRVGGGKTRVDTDLSAEKLAAELLWLAQKLAACRFAEQAVRRWALASNLSRLALLAEPRLQGSLVKVSAFLLKESKDWGYEEVDESKREQRRQTMKQMLISWLPLLCRANIGTDAPVLNAREKVEIEKVITEMIEMLEDEDEQEQVMSIWLHHFTHCPSSDWPNLHACYSRWCTASRNLLILQQSKLNVH